MTAARPVGTRRDWASLRFGGTMLRFIRLGALGLAFVCGCLGTGTSGSAGELGKGIFTYGCSGAADPACPSSGVFDPVSVDFGVKGDIPHAVATGAHFAITYYGAVYKGSERLAIVVRPAADEIVSAKGSLV